MASSKTKLTEEQIVEGLFSAILGSIVKGRTKKVMDLLKDNPELARSAKALDKATDDLKKSLAKTRKARAKAGNTWASRDNSLLKFQRAHDKKYGNKY